MSNLTGLFRITQDAEVRVTQSGDSVATVSLVYSYGNKKDERGYLPSQFVDAAIWGKRAEALSPYLTKGKKIYAVLSDPHVRTYTKQDGTTAATLSAKLDTLEFAGDREEQAQAPAPAARPQAPAPNPAKNTGSAFDDMEDIPF